MLRVCVRTVSDDTPSWRAASPGLVPWPEQDEQLGLSAGQAQVGTGPLAEVDGPGREHGGLGGEAGVDDRLARVQAHHHVDEVGGGGRLEQVALHADAQRLEHEAQVARRR